MGDPRRPPITQQEHSFVLSHASASATVAAAKVWKSRPDRAFRIDQIDYINPTGLVADASNFFTITLQKAGGNAIGTRATSTVALTANTATVLALSATDADLVVAAGGEMELVLTKTGTQTLPAGFFVVHGRFI